MDLSSSPTASYPLAAPETLSPSSLSSSDEKGENDEDEIPDSTGDSIHSKDEVPAKGGLDKDSTSPLSSPPSPSAKDLSTHGKRCPFPPNKVPPPFPPSFPPPLLPFWLPSPLPKSLSALSPRFSNLVNPLFLQIPTPRPFPRQVIIIPDSLSGTPSPQMSPDFQEREKKKDPSPSSSLSKVTLSLLSSPPPHHPLTLSSSPRSLLPASHFHFLLPNSPLQDKDVESPPRRKNRIDDSQEDEEEEERASDTPTFSPIGGKYQPVPYPFEETRTQEEDDLNYALLLQAEEELLTPFPAPRQTPPPAPVQPPPVAHSLAFTPNSSLLDASLPLQGLRPRVGR